MRTLQNSIARSALALGVLSFCLCALPALAHAESLSPGKTGFTGAKLRVGFLYSSLSLDYEEADSLPDYESWTGDSSDSRRGQRPTVALFKSMFVPGLGQIGNRQYIKAAIVIGVEGLLFSRWLKFRGETSDARAAFEAQAFGDPQRALLFDRFEEVKNDRNLFAWLTGTSIFLSMFDAFVDAHLRNFPGPGSDMSIAPFRPTHPFALEPPVIGATLSLRF